MGNKLGIHLCGLLVALGTPVLRAQTTEAAPPPPPRVQGAIESRPDWPHAKASDVDTVDGILTALYDVISGPAGHKRDWDRFRSLFVPDGRLIPIRALKTAPPDVLFLSPEDYVSRSQRTLERIGFFERGIATRVDAFGSMVHVYSTYESRHAKEDPEPYARGINSIEILKSDGRYYIVEVFWDAETPANPIPPKYLKDVK